MYNYYNYNELYHHGIRGMKWGVRRYQNSDGSLTPAGKKRYTGDKGELNRAKDNYKLANKEYSRAFNKAYNRSMAAFSPSKKHRQANDDRWNDALDKATKANEARDRYKAAKKKYNAEAADRRDEFRDLRSEIGQSRSIGEKLVTNILTGAFANRTYNSVIAAGGSKYEAAGVTAVTGLVGAPLGHLAVSAIYTSKAGRGDFEDR